MKYSYSDYGYGDYSYSGFGNNYSSGNQYSMFNDDDEYERKGHYYEVYFNDGKFEDTYGCVADSKYEALGKFMKKHPKKCFEDVIDIIDYGEDAYNI